MLPPVAALPEEEIAHFASGLDEQQRTYLNRLLGECLSSLGDDAYTAGAVVASNVSQYVDFTVSYTANFSTVENTDMPAIATTMRQA